MPGKNRIMIYGPKKDGTYVVEFRTAAGGVLAISIPRSEAHVIRHFQERMGGCAVAPIGVIASLAAPPRTPSERAARPTRATTSKTIRLFSSVIVTPDLAQRQCPALRAAPTAIAPKNALGLVYRSQSSSDSRFTAAAGPPKLPINYP
jgi:hypothetical protein